MSGGSWTDPDRRRRLWALLSVVIVIAAGTAGAGYWAFTRSAAGSAVRSDGPNFYQALASLNASVANESGGPWTLFSFVGIAAQAPYSPNVKGYINFNASVPINGCQAALNGLTMFNGTLPEFTGTFNSGTAPFWQFAYYSNVSSEVLVGTSVLGTPRVFAPFPMGSACTTAWGDFASNPEKWAGQILENGALPVNSPTAASVVWSNVDAGYLERSAPLTEVFTSGPAMFAATQDLPYGVMGVDFLGCGVLGVTGYGVAYYSGTTRSGEYSGGLNASTNCALQAPSYPGSDTGVYQLAFPNVSVTTESSTTWVTAPIEVNAVARNPTNGTLDQSETDMWGLANWWMGLKLTSSSGQLLPRGASECTAWVASVARCGANSSGWYVVQLSSQGSWQNSYGLTANGSGWAAPVTAVVSHQELVVVLPSSWQSGGDSLNITSTSLEYEIQGSIDL